MYANMAKWIGIAWIAFCLPATQSAIGYFWHVTDFHYDANASSSDDHSSCRGVGRRSGASNDRFGSYRCDSPWQLVLSAVKAMKDITAEDIEFIMWTGDSASRWMGLSGDESQRRVQGAVATVTALLRRYFPSTAVYPVVGGADMWPRGQAPPTGSSAYHHLANLWRIWLPPEAESTFRKGGYYVIEQAGLRLHLVALNTNLYSEINHITADSDDIDPGGQWAWLESILLKARRRKGTVYIFGHVPPGIYERYYSREGLHWFQDRFNRRYLQLVQTYSDVIVGQFFGHAHTDSFRVVYDDVGRPLSWVLLSPAVTPREPNQAENTGPNNPAVRLVKFNTDTGQVLDYTQYFLNLTQANLVGRSEWRVAYNFTRFYGVSDVSVSSLHSVASSLLSHPEVFQKYYYVNSVMRDNLPHCGTLCRQVHFCAATCVDYSDYDECVLGALPLDGTTAASPTLLRGAAWPLTLGAILFHAKITGD